jgi:hypothetical protein
LAERDHRIAELQAEVSRLRGGAVLEPAVAPAIGGSAD